ncbi:MAG: hypothetical protein P8013_05075 [Candidatus Sulfobium sp.]
MFILIQSTGIFHRTGVSTSLYTASPPGTYARLRRVSVINAAGIKHQAGPKTRFFSRGMKELEQMTEEKGVNIEKKTVKDLILRMQDMPPGEVP